MSDPEKREHHTFYDAVCDVNHCHICFSQVIQIVMQTVVHILLLELGIVSRFGGDGVQTRTDSGCTTRDSPGVELGGYLYARHDWGPSTVAHACHPNTLGGSDRLKDRPEEKGSTWWLRACDTESRACVSLSTVGIGQVSSFRTCFLICKAGITRLVSSRAAERSEECVNACQAVSTALRRSPHQHWPPPSPPPSTSAYHVKP
ncbi:hypothetical protein AAY473_031962 [Plecturocebus cupreus]